jgi:K+-transporting ATPase KdpF subunit
MDAVLVLKPDRSRKAVACSRQATTAAGSGEFPCLTSLCLQLPLVSSRFRWLTPQPAIISEEVFMVFDYSLAAFVTAGLMVYLVYALLRPERF